MESDSLTAINVFQYKSNTIEFCVAKKSISSHLDISCATILTTIIVFLGKKDETIVLLVKKDKPKALFASANLESLEFQQVFT